MNTVEQDIASWPEMPKGKRYEMQDGSAVVTFSGGDMGQMEDALHARIATCVRVLGHADQLRICALNEDWQTFDDIVDEMRALLAALREDGV